MSPVLRLPATGCAYFRQGRCFHLEHLNPGYDPAYRCVVLVRLHQVYDDFLGQADAFSLEETSARSLWEKRFTDFRGKYSGCQDHEPSDMNEFPGCAHALGDVCAKALPPCPGRCRHYVLKRLETGKAPG